MEQETDKPIADTHTATRDTSKHDEYENVANPLAPGPESADSGQSSPGQDGRNLRGLGSTDMDSEHGLLRQGDQDDSTMQVTPEAEASLANTGTDIEHKPTY